MTSTPRREVRNHRLGAVCAVVLATTAWVGLGVSPAHAQTGNTLTVSPVSGTVDDTLTLTTPVGCPSGTDASVARIVGPGFPTRGQNLTGVVVGFATPGRPFPVETAYTLRDTAALSYPAVTYKGTYRLEVLCRDLEAVEPLTVFTAAIRFTTPTNWSVVGGGSTTGQDPTTKAQAAPTPAPSSSVRSTPGEQTPTPQDRATQPATTGTGAQSKSDASPSPARTDAPAADSGGSSGGLTPGDSPTELAAAPAREASQSSASSTLVPAVLGALVGAVVVAFGVAVVRRPRSTGRRDAR